MFEYHVSKLGSDENDGGAEHPFLTVNRAAQVAEAGDTVTVHEGVYREWIKPEHSGERDKRITYRAAEGEHVTVKGSEVVTGWKRFGEIWKISLSNEMFGDYNPYAKAIDGDWLVKPRDPFRHTGEVYINGTALHEVFGIDEVKGGENTWFAEVDDEATVIYANFGKVEPDENLIEINVRKCCFYPDKTGIDYITVSGFEMAQAACPWAPPTAEQFGMLGAHWSCGWIIEDNDLHDAKCSAVSIGKNATVIDNIALLKNKKSGYQYQIENVFKGLEAGWRKGNIGSHIVRNNTIHECGQNGIVGHMGCAFSEVYGNHIYNIGNKSEFFGWEIAGIKFHAAIDVLIHDNYIHNCGGVSAIWLDWQTQGARICRNLFTDNNMIHGDVLIEVSHGPYMIDNNIFASDHNIYSVSQGGAYAHNLFLGENHKEPCLPRFTPYHFGHTTDIAGFACIYGNDDRWYQNIFAGTPGESDRWTSGTAVYNGCPASMAEYTSLERGPEGSAETAIQPAYIDGNCYFNGAEPYEREEHKLVGGTLCAKIVKEDGKVYLLTEIPQQLLGPETKLIGTDNLEPPRIVEQPYENPDGTALLLDTDYLGNKRDKYFTPGPIELSAGGEIKVQLWPRE